MTQDYKVSAIKKKISKDLWLKAKGTAMLEGKTLSEWLAEAVEDRIKKNGYSKK